MNLHPDSFRGPPCRDLGDHSTMRVESRLVDRNESGVTEISGARPTKRVSMSIRPGMKPAASRAVVAAAALLLFLASLVLFWPGVATYDSVGQFGQALAGDYDDWHPPVMAHAWAALHRAFGGAAEPMLVLQMALYWAGFGLIATALAQERQVSAAGAVLAIGAMPLFLGWQAVVLKDTQMLGAALAACGLVAWWRLRGRRVPSWAGGVVALLLGYAILIRANAVFAMVPLAVMLFGPRTRWARLALVVVGTGAVLAVAPVINHALLDATPSGVERTAALYDLAGTAVRTPDAPVGLSVAETRAVAARRCVKPLFWDPLGTPERCAPVMGRLRALPVGELYRLLVAAIARHPLAYAEHRLAHLNSTERWLVPLHWPAAAPPAASEPNMIGLGSPGAASHWWQAVATWLAETPFGWPIAWIVLAVAALVVAARRDPSGARDLALALLVSALAQEASFGVLSIASDLRYHLWAMVATALAAVLLRAAGRWPRRVVLAGGAALAIVTLAGVAARITLPPPPPSYAAQLE